jgi:transcriptional regulator with PAS, ATPase and Fis domain
MLEATRSQGGEAVGGAMPAVEPTGDLERIFFEIAKGVWSDTGENFFRSLAGQLLRALHADFVLVGALQPDGERIRTLAAYTPEGEVPAYEFDLAGTPSAGVCDKSVYSYAEDVHRLFPADTQLAGMQAEGFVGAPLIDSEGRCLGLISAITRQPLVNPKLAEAVLQIFAERATAELKRQEYEEALAHAEQRSRDFLIHGNEAMFRFVLEQPIPLDAPEDEQLDRAYRYGYVADCNAQAAAMFGLPSAAALIGARLEAISPRAEEDQNGRIRAFIRSGCRFSQMERTLAGRRLLMTREGVVKEGKWWGAWITGRDITDLKEAEAQVRQLNTELARAEQRARDFVTHGNEAMFRIGLEQPIALDASEDEHIEHYYRYGYVADCNDQGAALYGLPDASGLIGARFEVIAPRSDLAQIERLRTFVRERCSFSRAERVLAGRTLLMTREGIFEGGELTGAWVTSRDITELKEAEAQVRTLNTELQRRVEELNQLRARLEQDNAYMLEEIREEHHLDEMVGSSPRFLDLANRVQLVASTSATVLITGETGTGKELVARAIHNLGARRERPLVKVNCAGISAGLVESELFGHVRGAFTGATERRIGRFEYANGGTLFLDEVTELPLEIQAKLLRVLQEREFEPVGSNRTVKVDVRLLAATNRNLADCVRDGRFRMDLYYRLLVVPVEVPPLRERREDIPALAAHFIARYSRQFGRRVEGISESMMRQLMAYDWPGNIRELENLLAREVVLCRETTLNAPLFLSAAGAVSSGAPPLSMENAERRHIENALASAHWVLEGPKGAAAMLGLNPSTLRSRMKRLGIKRPG